MTTITSGITPTQFLAAINANLLALYGTGNYTTMTNVNQLTFDAALNANLSRSDVFVGLKGSSYENILNSNFTTIYHSIFDTAFINTLSDYAISPINIPIAQYYNGKTYIIFQSYIDDPYIITYTHATDTWSAPVKVGETHLATGDAHGQPAMLIDSNGYIHVVWGTHGGTFQYSKSTNPEDISSWAAQSDLWDGTYPQLLQFSDGTIYMFYRNAGGTGWEHRTSSDSGANWSSLTTVQLGFGYCVFKKGIGDTIHGLIFTYPGTTNVDRHNIYYILYSGGQWKNIKAENQTLPVTYLNDILVYDSGVLYTPGPNICFDSTNKPYIIFTEGTDFIGTYSYKFTKYVGSSWVVYSLGVSTNYWRDSFVSMDCVSPTHFDAYVITGGLEAPVGWDVLTQGVPVSLGGNVEKWSSTDGGVTWAKIETITSGHQYLDPVVVINHHANAKVFFAQYQGNVNRLLNGGWNNRGCLYGDGGFIGKRIDN